MDDFNDIEALNAVEESECFIQIFQSTYEKSGLKLLDKDNYDKNTTIQMVLYHNNTDNFARAMKSFLDSLVIGKLFEVEQSADDGNYQVKIVVLTNDEEE